MTDILIDVTLFSFLAITAIALVRVRNLFAVIMLFGIFSLLTAGLFVVMDAPDVAFTEAAVGAGIATVLMLATLALTRDQEEKPPRRRSWLALAIVVITGATLIYGTLDLPYVGDADAPAQTHVAKRYVEQGYEETGVPNLVTGVLASYRGFDTLGEVAVVFTAGVGVLLLIGYRVRRRRGEHEQEREETQ